MSDSGARIGDEVRIFWSRGDTLDATVKYIPQASGDSWIVWSNDGTIHHVQEFESLHVLNRKADIANAPADRPAKAGERSGL
jgi:DNA-binding transcriptional regulator LsrR (DeoR family)